MTLNQTFRNFIIQMSLVMRKPAICICENKDADQLRGNLKLINTFVFATRIVQSLYFLFTKKFKHRAILYGCTAWFMLGLVGNPGDRFSHNEAQMGVIQFYHMYHLKPGCLYCNICCQWKFGKILTYNVSLC